jgi:hypothetical protein
MMIVEKFAFRHVIDDNRSATIANFVADCRFDVEFPAGQQPESNFVTNGAGNPTILRYLALLRRIPSQLCGKLLPESMRPHRFAKLRKYQPPGRHRAWRAAKEFPRSLACLSAADGSRTSPMMWRFCTFLKQSEGEIWEQTVRRCALPTG